MRFYQLPPILLLFTLVVVLAEQTHPPQAFSSGKMESSPKNMNALIQLEEVEYEIYSPNKAFYRVHRIVQIFNEKGKEEHQLIRVEENDLKKCRRLFGSVMDTANLILEKVDKSDIAPEKIAPGYAEYEQYIYWPLRLSWKRFPYTIEYEYEIEHKTLFYWPNWIPQSADSILQSSYTLILNKPLIYNMHSIGINQDPQKKEAGGKTTLKWTLRNLEPRIEEDYMPPEYYLQRALLFAPAEFDFKSTRGSFQSWNHFANWYRDLAKGKYIVADNIGQEIDSILISANNNMEKVEKIYQFVQQTTRFVPLDIGVGDWEPYSASFVHETKYGDGNALTTYLIALLRGEGIDAYPGIIRTVYKGLELRDFPYSWFDHVVVVVPLENDTIWLDCKYDYLPAGELPYEDEGCDVLIIGENNGTLVQAPQSDAEDNLWKTHVDGRIATGGKLSINEGSITLTGNFGNVFRKVLIPRRPEERERILRHLLGFYCPEFDLQNLKIKNLDDNLEKPVSIEFDGSYCQLGIAPAGRRLFFNPNLIHQLSRNLPDNEEERIFPINYYFPFTLADELTIQTPRRYQIEAAPQPQNISTEFGHYSTKFAVEDSLSYKRNYNINIVPIPPSLFEDFRNFRKQAAKNDNDQFVLRR